MVKIGDTVTVNYTGTIKETGEVFDTTEGRDPHTFKIGHDPLIKGFVNALVGRNVGDRFTFDIPMSEGYGEYQEGKVQRVPRGYMPGEVYVDQILLARGANGDEARVLVMEVADDYVVIDGNHPLAGMNLVFDVEIVDAV